MMCIVIPARSSGLRGRKMWRAPQITLCIRTHGLEFLLTYAGPFGRHVAVSPHSSSTRFRLPLEKEENCGGNRRVVKNFKSQSNIDVNMTHKARACHSSLSLKTCMNRRCLVPQHMWYLHRKAPPPFSKTGFSGVSSSSNSRHQCCRSNSEACCFSNRRDSRFFNYSAIITLRRLITMAAQGPSVLYVLREVRNISSTVCPFSYAQP